MGLGGCYQIFTKIKKNLNCSCLTDAAYGHLSYKCHFIVPGFCDNNLNIIVDSPKQMGLQKTNRR
jgi:hypothetical protein